MVDAAIPWQSLGESQIVMIHKVWYGRQASTLKSDIFELLNLPFVNWDLRQNSFITIQADDEKCHDVQNVDGEEMTSSDYGRGLISKYLIRMELEGNFEEWVGLQKVELGQG